MKKVLFFAAMSLALFSAMAQAEMQISSNAVDISKIESHIRQAVSVPDQWSIAIGNLKESAFPYFYSAEIIYTFQNNTRNQPIFISTDSSYYIIGNAYDTRIDLENQRKQTITTKDAAQMGDPKAPIKVVEFSDLQCSACKHAHDFLKSPEGFQSWGEDVELIFKHFPLRQTHPWAEKAALAGICVEEQKEFLFWEFSNFLFTEQQGINAENFDSKLSEFAAAHQLKFKKLEQCMQKDSTRKQLDRDIAEGQAIGIFSTPTFVINGRIAVGTPDANSFRMMIDSARQKAQKMQSH